MSELASLPSRASDAEYISLTPWNIRKSGRAPLIVALGRPVLHTLRRPDGQTPLFHDYGIELLCKERFPAN